MTPAFIPEISVIIPTLNEEECIADVIGRLSDTDVSFEVIVVDAESEDATQKIAGEFGAKVITTSKACRALQMNIGAKDAKAEVLCFLHADTLPPRRFLDQILDCIQNVGVEMGCFRYKFNTTRKSLQFNAWCTRFPVMMFRGGDQSLFITRDLFQRLNGFNGSMAVMEDFDIIRRGRKLTPFHIIPNYIMVSARKYDSNSYVRVNLANFLIFSLYYFGWDTQKLRKLYGRLINHPKDRGEC